MTLLLLLRSADATEVSLAGAAAASSSLTGTSTVTATLAAAPAAVSTASGGLAVTATLAGQPNAASTASAGLTAHAGLAATPASTSAASAVLTVTGTLAATVGSASTVTATLTVGAPPQVLAPSADSVDGAWTTDTGGADLTAAIDESTPSDSDYIRSELAPSTSKCRLKLAAGNDPHSSTGHVIKWRVGKDTTGGPQVNVTVSLRQGGGNTLGGGSLVASFTRNDVDALTTFEEALSGAEADAITDYADLFLEFEASQV